MAVYTGTVEVLWSLPLGNKTANLVRVRVRSYVASGIPLSPSLLGLGGVEAVIPFLHGQLGDSEAPALITYDPVNSVLLCYTASNTRVLEGTNIYATTGDIMLLVLGS